jgi:hypothetical protein
LAKESAPTTFDARPIAASVNDHAAAGDTLSTGLRISDLLALARADAT